MQLCSIGIHKYTKWQQIEEGQIVRTKDKSSIGKYIVQERICEACNKKQLDTQRSYAVE